MCPLPSLSVSESFNALHIDKTSGHPYGVVNVNMTRLMVPSSTTRLLAGLKQSLIEGRVEGNAEGMILGL